MSLSDPFIEALVAEHSSYLYRLAISIVRDSGEAEDIVQDAYVTAMLQQHKLEANSNYRAWLSTVVVNRCRDRLRRRKVRDRWQNTLQSLRAYVSDPCDVRPLENSIEHLASNDELWQAVAKLPEKFQLPIILRYNHGMTAHEIAAILGIKEGTVYSRIHTALRRLAVILSSPLTNTVHR